ncbi:RNA polymerase subunit sigma-24 [Clostridium thermosuccinogenes]|uniref:RNA polymerase subunit sigma-24 n=3 Tax=Clostridium thermosuccinogenes TaxID=84032 RepID=A0A2K2FD54_9CLOT|nr:sigma-70 family RNA polymerase sigma factor [Pseudoclostridium thermosuccinogenes]AUS97129.1 RNA polymerase subunit sigma-24 [Pseudoclostridium thermosuccinogenes]PNT95559.1 RNA polymerase subunit sigma-24 [Pseudoclostridium thermosuccinogenes]PNT96720.1 RNA polymerase subunit sigma-24 [Pseudoclostridium thermosuccinogenes]
MLLFLATIKDENSKKKLEALYLKYKKDMFNVAYRILDDYQLAQDAVQTAFINIMDNLDKIENIYCNKTRAFVIIIVRNISINLYKKRKKHILLEDIDDTLPDDKQMIDEMIIDADILSKISSKIRELRPDYSDIISLKYFYHYSDDEIARLLNITPGNVRVRLHRAKQRLIMLLSEDRELTKSE